MMRLHLTAADLCQIAFAPAPNALQEAALSLRRPPARGWSRPGVRAWQRHLNGGLKARAGALADVVPRSGFLPDFLLQPDADDLSACVELARHTPADRLEADLDLITPSPGQPSWVRDLACGEAAAWDTFAGDVHRYFDSSLAPWWPLVRDTAAADRALRSETLLRGGTGALLATLSPHCRWEPPVLHVRISGDYDVELCGRGLLLVPSYFATGPMVMYRPDASTVLVYPMHGADESATAKDALGPLLGRTRAGVLAALRRPATTSALADRLAISRASASEHTTVLRNAGLVTTSRMGNAVLHTLTPLGWALLGDDSPA
ncbi:winged helix-turn-helix domain-containing protein [Nonomuraea pusilla]|uniref:ArsR/SmtB family transcription factor n=1 Tax=Nonomuraea pusilla TaxID=46177 RepID=UPI003319DF68